MNSPKVIGKATIPMDREKASKFLASTGFWDKLPPDEREAFIARGEVLDTKIGNELAKFIGLRGAEAVMEKRHFRRN